MKLLANENLPDFLATSSSRYALRVPIQLADGGRSLGSLEDGPLAMTGGALPAKPTAFFFPQEDLVFTAQNDKIHPAPPIRNRLFIIGFTPTDLRCLRFIDRFFANVQRDDIYFRLRDGAVIAAVSGFCGKEGAFITPAGDDCDLEFIFDGSNWILCPYSQIGNDIVADLEDAPADSLEKLWDAVSATGRDEEAIILQAANILRNVDIPDNFWDGIGKLCIQCTGCNLVCPTCTCFGMQDWRYNDKTERMRMWDSCQLEGFMREAGGHNPLGTATLRTRRRIHHKLAADLERWGEISCFVCGRCDATCPTGIGIVAVARKIVAQFGTFAVNSKFQKTVDLMVNEVETK